MTGADGFVGRRLVDLLLAAGHEVIAGVREGAVMPQGVRALPLEVRDAASVRQAVTAGRLDAVAHLAAVASGAEALADPVRTWEVNTVGTARLVAELAQARRDGEGDPALLLVSTAEVYAPGPQRPLVETDPVRPRSPYAASKLAAELAAQETAARAGLRLVIARSFPHTGPGQDDRFVAPAFAKRLLEARRSGARTVKTGNLAPVRDILDVRDVARAYLLLLERGAQGAAGEVYNVASGRGISMDELFRRLAAAVGVSAVPEPDPALLRPVDLPYLVGDHGKLRAATGWEPRIDLDTTLADLVHAQAN